MRELGAQEGQDIYLPNSQSYNGFGSRDLVHFDCLHPYCQTCFCHDGRQQIVVGDSVVAGGPIRDDKFIHNFGEKL